jgi:hypothetical protein
VQSHLKPLGLVSSGWLLVELWKLVLEYVIPEGNTYGVCLVLEFVCGAVCSVICCLTAKSRFCIALHYIGLCCGMHTIARSDRLWWSTNGYVRGLDLTPSNTLVVCTAHCIHTVQPSTKTVRLIAGMQGESGHRDGVAALARFSDPMGLCVSNGEGVAYVADCTCIRRVTLPPHLFQTNTTPTTFF